MEKTLKIGLTLKGHTSRFRATNSIREFRREIAKHFRTKTYSIDNSVNEYFWDRGRNTAKSSIEIISVNDNNKLRIFLLGSQAYKDYQENKNKAQTSKKEDVKLKKQDKKEEVNDSEKAVIETKKEVKKESKAEKPKSKTTKTK